MKLTYRQLHKRQQNGEFPNVGKSPYGFDWRKLPALARLHPDALVELCKEQEQPAPEQKPEQEQGEGQKQGQGQGQGQATFEQKQGQEQGQGQGQGQGQRKKQEREQAASAQSKDDGDANERKEPSQDADDGSLYRINLEHGGYAQQGKPAVPQMDAQMLMRNALSKLSGGFDTRLTPQYDSVKLIKRLATARDYSIARREEDGNPTVLFIGDNSPSCEHMVEQMTQILLYASKLGTRGCDVWLLIASNGVVLKKDVNRYEKGVLSALLAKQSQQAADIGDLAYSMRLYRNGKPYSIQKLLKISVDNMRKEENLVPFIVDAIAPTHIFNVGDSDSLSLIFEFMTRKNTKTAHVYALYGRLDTLNSIYNPIRDAVRIHKKVSVARVSTSHYPFPATVALIEGGNTSSGDDATALWQIAYAVNFICSPDKLCRIPMATF